MAGKPGRSGGPRPNAGGKRPGAGRPRKRPHVVPETTTPMQFLIAVMLGRIDPTDVQLDAAILAARIEAATGGKRTQRDEAATAGRRAQRDEAARRAASGRYAPYAPPDELKH